MGKIDFSLHLSSRLLRVALLISLIPGTALAADSFVVTIPDLNPGGVKQLSDSSFLVVGGQNNLPVVYRLTVDANGNISSSMQAMPGLPGGTGTGAIGDVSRDGNIFVGSSDSPSAPIVGVEEAIFWNSSGVPTSIGLGYNSGGAQIGSVSENGIGVGNGSHFPCVFSIENGIVPLNTTTAGVAYEISGDGKIAVGSVQSAPVFWTANTPGVSYSESVVQIPADGVAAGDVYSVSPNGQWLGGSYFSFNEQELVGAIWNSSGTLIHRFSVGSVRAVTDGAAGFDSLATGESEAFIFLEGSAAPVLLTEHLQAQGIDLTTPGITGFDWIIRMERGLNNRGLLILGRARIGLNHPAFLAYIAEGVEPQTCEGLPATIVGTEDDDFLEGTDGPDVIVGLGGDDFIHSRNGNDIVCAGPGNDTVYTRNGADIINGDDGNDRLSGGGNSDVIRGGAGNDYILGGGHDDSLFGDDGDDLLNGGPGLDNCNVGAPSDSIAPSRGEVMSGCESPPGITKAPPLKSGKAVRRP